MTARRVTFTRDIEHETDERMWIATVEVIADVDTDEAVPMREAVTFIEPTPRELLAWSERNIDRLVEDACQLAAEDAEAERAVAAMRERVRREERAALKWVVTL